MRITDRPVSIKNVLLDQTFAQNGSPGLIVPIYQRPYSWRKSDCQDLIDDCENWIENNQGKHNDLLRFASDPDHYSDFNLGMIITCREAVDAPLEIVDGQQRITTVSLALLACYDLILSTDVEPGQQHDVLKQIIIEGIKSILLNAEGASRIKHTYIIDQAYNDLIQQVIMRENVNVPKGTVLINYEVIKKYIRSYIEGQLDSYKSLLIMTRLLYATKFILLETDGEEDKLRLFKTLNSRGLELSDGDLIKNLIYERMRYYNQEAVATNDLLARWNDVRESLKDSKTFDERIFDYINTFPEHALLPCLARYRSKDKIIRKNSLHEGIDALVRETIDNGEDIAHFAEDLIYGVELCQKIKNALLDGFEDVLSTIKSFSLKRVVFLLAYIYKRFEDSLDEVANMYSILEKFFVRFLIIGGSDNKTLDKFMYELMFEIETLIQEDVEASDVTQSVLKYIKETKNDRCNMFDDSETENFKAQLLTNNKIKKERVVALYKRVFGIEVKSCKGYPETVGLYQPSKKISSHEDAQLLQVDEADPEYMEIRKVAIVNRMVDFFSL